MGVQVSFLKNFKNIKVQVIIKSVDTGKTIGSVYCIPHYSYICLGTQTDFEELIQHSDVGVKCKIGHFGHQRSSIPDIEPIQYTSITDEESIDYNEEISESFHEEPKPKPVIVK